MDTQRIFRHSPQCFNFLFGRLALDFDVLMVGDPRFPGGTSTSIAAEVAALAGGGYSVGLLPVAGPVLKYPHPVNKSITQLVEAGQVTLVPRGEPVSARLCLLHHPQVFHDYPEEPWRVRAEMTRMVVHHPPTDGLGAGTYDAAAIHGVVTDLFGDVAWAPVGPKVRDAFRRVEMPPPLTPDDWLNVIDCDNYHVDRTGFRPGRPVIGRHSRPDPAKWPADRETFLKAYPDRPDIVVRLMGYGPELDQIVGRRPAGWRTLPFDAMPVRTFLAGIDFFVYFHSPVWIEAFGRSILEAIAAGAVPILPEDFRPLFQEAAIYAKPDKVAEMVLELHADPRACSRQIAMARELVAERFGPRVAVNRVRDLIGDPAPRRSPARATKRAALFVTSNGVGMGHLTRALAVARRLPDTLTPVVASMSKAFAVGERDGIRCEYITYHKNVGLDYDVWQASIDREIGHLIAHVEPSVFVFDGNVPYDGMMRATRDFPHLWKVWLRRGMWAPGTGENHIRQQDLFDAVIEPGEIAAPFDRGLAQINRQKTILVPPIRYLRDDEALSREEARDDLGLAPDDTAVLMQLGSENNFDFSAARRQVLTKLRGWPGMTLVNAEWLIRDAREADPGPDVRRLRVFPIARHLAAFDFAVSACGYNTFHENLAAALPTVFVANENPEQDEQWRRAHYAELKGAALACRMHNPLGLDRALDRMLLEDERAAIRDACKELPASNGAVDAAEYLANLAYFRR